MKRIKTFSLFLESESNEGYPEMIFMKIGVDEDYGVPRVEIDDFTGTWKDPEYSSREDIFDDCLYAPYGPIKGPDCWDSVNSPLEEYYEAEAEGDEDAMYDAKESIDGWLRGWEIGEYDVDKFVKDPDYYEEIKNRYIANNREYFDNNVFQTEKVYNYFVLSLVPSTKPEWKESEDLYANYGNMFECVKDLSSPAFVCLAYIKGDNKFYLLEKNGKMAETPYHKGQTPEQIKELILSENSELIAKSLLDVEPEELRKVIDKTPLNVLITFIKENPMNIDLLDGHPKIKAEVMKGAGMEQDISDLARAMRKGLL